jgi:hypothetical protein
MVKKKDTKQQDEDLMLKAMILIAHKIDGLTKELKVLRETISNSSSKEEIN